jgi:Tfp pilus assembly protein PilZ
MPRLDEERRSSTRYRLVAAVRLTDGTKGQTRDMSTDGVFFKTEKSYALGQTISFSVNLQESIVQCRGRVMRVEPLGTAFGIAVALDFYDFA